MPRFQSRLFNWIDQSLPAQIGRRARRALDIKFEQIAEAFVSMKLQEVPRLLAYQIARAALYPVYVLNRNVQKIFPLLDRRKKDANAIRSSEAQELLSESKTDLENSEAISEVDLLNSETPQLLRPLLSFFNWIDRTKIRLDRNITAIIKPSDNLVSSKLADYEDQNQTYISNRISNHIFAKIWQQIIEAQDNQNTDQNSLKESTTLSESRALGENNKIEYLRKLIESAIAYFFGKDSSQTTDSLVDRLDGDVNRNEVLQGSNNGVITDDPKSKQQLRSRKFDLSSSSKIKNSDSIDRGANLSRLQELLTAAIDYFTSRRSLKDDKSDDQSKDKLESLENTETVLDSNSDSFGQIKLDDQIERLRKLIEDAVDYFFGKQRSPSEIEATNSIEISKSSSLTIESLFADDNGPWPLPLEYESVAFTNSPDLIALNSSGELQFFETTTSQLSQDRLEGGSFFVEEGLSYQSIHTENERPLRAWIEAQATILGYAYSPVMTVVFWFDEIILKIENLIIMLWKKLVNLPKKLLGK